LGSELLWAAPPTADIFLPPYLSRSPLPPSEHLLRLLVSSQLPGYIPMNNFNFSLVADDDYGAYQLPF
jgi:hypothetical protein